MSLSSQTRDNWQSFADDCGLTFRDSVVPNIEGVWENFRLNIYLAETRSGLSRKFATKLSIATEHIFNTSFLVTRQGAVEKLAELIGAGDIQTGNPEFDSAALIKGWNEEVIQSFFGCSKVQTACLKILTNDYYETVEISHRSISVSVSDIVTTGTGIATILRVLAKAMSALEAIDAPNEAPEKCEPTPPPEELLEVETVEEIPAVTVSIAPLIEPPQKLTAERLNREFLNRTVDWTGEVRHIIPACQNDIFDDNSGWIATLELLKIPDVGMGRYTIHYRIGQERKEAFDQTPGTKMQVQGRMKKLEEETASIFIDSGDEQETGTTYSATVVIPL